MTRTAGKGKVSAQFFRVDGADLETGEETFLVLQAPTKPQAEKLAREQGMLISTVRVARPDDWKAAPPPAASKAQPQPAAAAATLPEPEPELKQAPEPPTEPSPFLDVATPVERETVEPSTVVPAPQPLEPAPPLPSITPRQSSSAGAIFLGFIGGALVIGGVLALVLALWHDNAIRNELEQIEFRLYQLIQTILGGILVLGGLLIFSLSVICHMLAKRSAST